MKKLTLLLIILAGFVTANAQRIVTLTPSKSTLTNTDTSNFVVPFNTTATVATFQVNVTKLTGNDTGTVYLMGSVDNVNFLNIGADSAAFIGTKSVIFPSGQSNYPYYQLRVTTKSTGGASQTSGVGGLLFYYK